VDATTSRPSRIAGGFCCWIIVGIAGPSAVTAFVPPVPHGATMKTAGDKPSDEKRRHVRGRQGGRRRIAANQLTMAVLQCTRAVSLPRRLESVVGWLALIVTPATTGLHLQRSSTLPISRGVSAAGLAIHSSTRRSAHVQPSSVHHHRFGRHGRLRCWQFCTWRKRRQPGEPTLPTPGFGASRSARVEVIALLDGVTRRPLGEELSPTRRWLKS
jgi:hypothetical protein